MHRTFGVAMSSTSLRCKQLGYEYFTLALRTTTIVPLDSPTFVKSVTETQKMFFPVTLVLTKRPQPDTNLFYFTLSRV